MIDYTKFDTTIYINGMAIHQPVPAFSDFLISILCFYFFLKLNRISSENNKTTKTWKLFYLLLFIASLTGGINHAFFTSHMEGGGEGFWLTMQVANVISVYVAQQATLSSVLNESKNKKLWNIIYLIQLFLFLVAIFVFHNFLVVIVNSALGMVPIMIQHFKYSKKTKGDNLIGWGIAILSLTAIINGTKLAINEYFTHQDIAHVIIIISLFVMFAGVKQKAIS